MATTVRQSGPPTLPARVRVLIADDDVGVRVLLKRWLERQGSFDVTLEAADGIQAVDAARRGRPELALLDLAMPRMDGLEAATEIRRLLPEARIVIRSAFSAVVMAERAIDAGADVYVEKAADRDQLLAVLEELFPARDTGSGSDLPAMSTAQVPARTSLDGLLLDALDVGVLRVDQAGRVRSANFAATLALGVPTSHLVGSSLSALLAGARHEDGRDVGGGLPDPVTEALTSGRPGSGRVLQLDKPDGGSVCLSINVRPILGAEGLATGAVAVVSDVTEDRRLREALRDADARLRSFGEMRQGMGSTMPPETTELLETALSVSPVGAVLLDSSCRLVIANPVADHLLGGSLLLGPGPPSRVVSWADTLEPVRYEDLPVQAACQGKPFDDVELYVAKDDGSDGGTYVRISGRPVLGAKGHPAGAVISVLDDTATKAAEQALAEIDEELRRSNTELANFASIASHDLSQPLQAIHGFAQLLQEDGIEDPQAPYYINRIVIACERMRTLIRDLLTYSRLTTDTRPFEAVDLASVFQEAIELFEHEITTGDARIEVVDPLPTLVADRTQMSQLLQNLIDNALTYVASGVAPVIRVHSARGEREWQITVEDNGIGISPENRQRAFGMFQRLATPEEHSGTGIGLAVCAKVVERHGGRIWIEGNPGDGTRFCFTLPDRPHP